MTARKTNTDFTVTVHADDLITLIKAASEHADTLTDRAYNEPDRAERYNLDNQYSRLAKKIEKLRTKWCAGFLRHQRMTK